MTDRIGPTFAAELAAAGLGPGIAWDPAAGALTYTGVSDADRARAAAVLAAHDPARQPPPPPRQLLGSDFLAALFDLGWLALFDQGAADQAAAGKPLDQRRYATIGKADLVIDNDAKLLRVAAAAARRGTAATPAVPGISLAAVFDRALPAKDHP